MTEKKQEDAFERELHRLCTHFFDEWDIDPWSMIEILEAEKLFVICLIEASEEEDDDDDFGFGDIWSPNGGV